MLTAQRKSANDATPFSHNLLATGGRSLSSLPLAPIPLISLLLVVPIFPFGVQTPSSFAYTSTALERKSSMSWPMPRHLRMAARSHNALLLSLACLMLVGNYSTGERKHTSPLSSDPSPSPPPPLPFSFFFHCSHTPRSLVMTFRRQLLLPCRSISNSPRTYGNIP